MKLTPVFNSPTSLDKEKDKEKKIINNNIDKIVGPGSYRIATDAINEEKAIKFKKASRRNEFLDVFNCSIKN